MEIRTMRCTKCGYTQMVRQTCKSCGIAINGQPAPKACPQPSSKPTEKVMPVQAKPAQESSVTPPKSLQQVTSAG